MIAQDIRILGPIDPLSDENKARIKMQDLNEKFIFLFTALSGLSIVCILLASKFLDEKTCSACRSFSDACLVEHNSNTSLPIGIEGDLWRGNQSSLLGVISSVTTIVVYTLFLVCRYEDLGAVIKHAMTPMQGNCLAYHYGFSLILMATRTQWYLDNSSAYDKYVAGEESYEVCDTNPSPPVVCLPLRDAIFPLLIYAAQLILGLIYIRCIFGHPQAENEHQTEVHQEGDAAASSGWQQSFWGSITRCCQGSRGNGHSHSLELSLLHPHVGL